jgi:hypothetical protein
MVDTRRAARVRDLQTAKWEGRPAVAEWPDTMSAPLGQTRLGAFRAAHPDVEVMHGPGFWEADYTATDGRAAYKARYELPVLLDDLEEELGR